MNVSRPSAFFSMIATLTFLGVTGCQSAQKKGGSLELEVAAMEVQPQDVVIYQDFVGTVDGVENAEIRARVAGYLEEVHFREGAHVKKGELLFTIDPVLSEAEVRKARGDVAMAQASMAKSQADVDRLAPLVATNAVSRQELEHAQADQQLATAQVLAAQGAFATAQASLDYTKVKSPIDGIIGVRNVSIGTLVGQSEPTLLTTVSQLETVRVRFPISEQLYLEHAALLNRLSNMEERQGSLRLILTDGSTYPQRGWLAMVDRAVSISTGSIMLEARFPNKEGLLRPGQFGRVRAPVGHLEGAIGVLQRAVIERQSMYELLVLDASNKVVRKSVEVGPKVGSYWIITKGLEPGEKVLTEGLQKLKPGMVVKPRLIDSKPISPPNKDDAPITEFQPPPEESGDSDAKEGVKPEASEKASAAPMPPAKPAKPTTAPKAVVPAPSPPLAPTEGSK